MQWYLAVGREDGVDGAELSGQAHELRAHRVTLQLRLTKVHTPTDAQHSRGKGSGTAAERAAAGGGEGGVSVGGGVLRFVLVEVVEAGLDVALLDGLH